MECAYIITVQTCNAMKCDQRKFLMEIWFTFVSSQGSYWCVRTTFAFYA